MAPLLSFLLVLAFLIGATSADGTCFGTGCIGTYASITGTGPQTMLTPVGGALLGTTKTITGIDQNSHIVCNEYRFANGKFEENPYGKTVPATCDVGYELNPFALAKCTSKNGVFGWSNLYLAPLDKMCITMQKMLLQ
ncbi:uncharacterized protein LOC135812838 [Sycon ciliatum]|uniref:uncharacterized protein LOC135812838 n=1 Tax=Sycon ciliatum TaxID=27933 RepID=UPI0031F6B6F6